MDDPYIPPERRECVPNNSKTAGYTAPLIGCGFGGCLLPILLFLACGILLSDTGGLLFWPFIAVPLGFIGLVAGFIYRASKK